MVGGHDAVISAFNPGWGNPDIFNLQVKGAQAIIDGTKKAGVKRLLFVGGRAAWKSHQVCRPWICRAFPRI